ncbi:MAG: hypothetical protein QG597_87, partial [Actinomycetota bacterium]|nr:hypothetical protein [Actinomycetota bacterium]
MTTLSGGRREVGGRWRPKPGTAMWVAFGVFGTTQAWADQGGSTLAQTTAEVWQVVLVATVTVRVLTVAWQRPARRASMVALAVGTGLWFAGVVVIATTTDPAVVQLPLSPGEWLFLAAYLGFGGFLLLDAHGTKGSSRAVWLEAVIMGGGAGCLAAVLVLLPVAASVDEVGVPLLLALLYPLCDLLLMVLTIVQVGLRQRSASVRTALLVAGFAVWALADAAFASRLAAGQYDFTLAMNLAWGLAIVLIAQGACLPRPPVTETPRMRFGGATLLTAGAIAVAVLAIPHPPGLEVYLKVLPLLTLAAVAARVAIALRRASTATEAYRMSVSDDLTGLPNRRGILATLDRQSEGSPRSLLLLGIDSFRDVNESIGHGAGDAVLQLFALRLRESVPPNVLVGRFEGDCFVVALGQDDPAEVLAAAESIRQALGEPFRAEGVEIALNVSVGVAIGVPDDMPQESSAELLRRSSAAMYQAKADRVGVCLYDAASDDSSRHQLRNAEALRHALANDQIEVWFQPQVDAATRRIVGLEALVRWNHPVHGIRPPAVFLPTARRAGLMPTLTEFVLCRAVAQARQWHDLGHTWHVAVNIAPPELLSGSVLPYLQTLVRGTGLPRGALGVEVTEDSFLTDPGLARDLLGQLHAEGVEISVDDFGTGFSSLAYLRDLHAR